MRISKLLPKLNMQNYYTIKCSEHDLKASALNKQIALSAPAVELHAMRSECESLRETLRRERQIAEKQKQFLEKRLSDEVRFYL